MGKTISLLLAFLLSVTLTLGTMSCEKKEEEKPPPTEAQEVEEKAVPKLVLFVYGDSRTGLYLFEWGDNNKYQRIHHKLALHMKERFDTFKHQNIKNMAVIFTGDAVHSGRCDSHWKSFYRVIKIFDFVKLYPCIGNHEVVWLPCPIAPKELTKDELQDPLTKAFLKEREQWNEAMEKKDDIELFNIVARLQELEVEAEKRFFLLSPQKRLEKGFEILKRRYIEEAGLKYLENIIIDHVSYYSLILSDNAPIKLVVLDTNALGSEQQLNWFQEETKTVGNGIMIVLAHHPPGATSRLSGALKANKYWKRFYSNFFDDPYTFRIPLWISADTHNYQRVSPRREQRGEQKMIDPPLIIVSGGGGAPLSSAHEAIQPNVGSSPWQKPFIQVAYHYLELKIFDGYIDVTVWGMERIDDSIKKLDNFKVALTST